MTLTVKKALTTAIVKYLVVRDYTNLLADILDLWASEGPMPIQGLLIIYFASDPVLYGPSHGYLLYILHSYNQVEGLRGSYHLKIIVLAAWSDHLKSLRN